MLDNLVGRWREWRYGGITGLNYVEANARMTAFVTIPWLIGYLACMIVIPDPFLELSIILVSGVWIAYVYGIYAYAKVSATRYRCFPQSQWRFPDGGTRKFNLMIPPDGFSKECDLEDAEGWMLNLGRNYQYWDKRAEFPFVFRKALLRLPAPPDQCFQYLSAGEFFHRGIAIRHPACEDISVYIWGWVQDKDGAYYPVGTLNDCSAMYNAYRNDGGELSDIELKEKDARKMELETVKNQFRLVDAHSKTLESIVGTRLLDSENFKKRVEGGMSEVRKHYKNIMSTEPPLLQRIKSSLWKIAIVILLIMIILYLTGVITF